MDEEFREDEDKELDPDALLDEDDDSIGDDVLDDLGLGGGEEEDEEEDDFFGGFEREDE